MLAIPRKQRAMVRKGIAHGLRSEIDAARRPLLRALRRQHAPARHAGAVAKRYFERLRAAFGDACEC